MLTATQRFPMRSGQDSSSTRVDRLLLFLVCAMLPLDDHLPVVFGRSTLFFVFVGLGVYVLTFRVKRLSPILLHPLFGACFLFLAMALTLESLHPQPSFRAIAAGVQMVGGGALLACLCRDRAAAMAAIFGCVGASVWLAIMLLTTSYSALNAAQASNYHQASHFRSAIVGSGPLQANLNTMAFFAAQGGALALALGLTASRRSYRIAFLAVSFGCLVASLLPMSRTGMAIAALCSVTAIWGGRMLKPSTVLLGVVIAVGTVSMAPRVIFARMTVSSEQSRVKLYQVALDKLPKYAIIGVGAGNFWSTWGAANGFEASPGSGPQGAHNTLVQVFIEWGLLAVLALLGILALGWRAITSLARSGDRGLVTCVRVIALAGLVWLMTVHTFYDKQFSVCLALLAAGDRFLSRPGRGATKVMENPRSYLRHPPPSQFRSGASVHDRAGGRIALPLALETRSPARSRDRRNLRI